MGKNDQKTRNTGERTAFFQLDLANPLLRGLWPRPGELEKSRLGSWSQKRAAGRDFENASYLAQTRARPDPLQEGRLKR